MDQTGSLQQLQESPPSLGRQGAHTNAQVASEPELIFTASLGSTPARLVPPRFKQAVLTGTPGAIWSFIWYSSASSVLLYRQRQRHPDSAKNLGNK